MFNVKNTHTGINYFVWFNGDRWILQEGYAYLGSYKTRAAAITSAKLRR